MTEEERIEQIAEARQFYMIAPVLLPLLAKRKRHAHERLMSAYREGNHGELTALTSELYAFDQLEREVNHKAQTYTALEEKNGKR